MVVFIKGNSHGGRCVVVFGEGNPWAGDVRGSLQEGDIVCTSKLLEIPGFLVVSGSRLCGSKPDAWPFRWY